MIKMTPPSYGSDTHLPSIGRCFLARETNTIWRRPEEVAMDVWGSCRASAAVPRVAEFQKQGVLPTLQTNYIFDLTASAIPQRPYKHMCGMNNYQASLPFARRLRAPKRGSGDHARKALSASSFRSRLPGRPSMTAQQMYGQVRAQVHGSHVEHGTDNNQKIATGTTAVGFCSYTVTAGPTNTPGILEAAMRADGDKSGDSLL